MFVITDWAESSSQKEVTLYIFLLRNLHFGEMEYVAASLIVGRQASWPGTIAYYLVKINALENWRVFPYVVQ